MQKKLECDLLGPKCVFRFLKKTIELWLVQYGFSHTVQYGFSHTVQYGFSHTVLLRVAARDLRLVTRQAKSTK
jgi:hypothetical protein